MKKYCEKMYETGFGHASIFSLGILLGAIITSLLSANYSKFMISFATLLVATGSLGFSFYFWRLSFRPIVSAMVVTHKHGSEASLFSLEVKNSGSIPAKNIQLIADMSDIENALGEDIGEQNRDLYLRCFLEDTVISILHNNSSVKCSFGLIRDNDKGFWKYKSIIPIVIEYYGWFGKKYTQEQKLQIIDSETFTGCKWGDGK